ncbi:MAG TPA: retention module-containing protein, partial [Methylophilaceae bacterium]|nr:retention module-containing protein [Methylophilaceae bacterium]
MAALGTVVAMNGPAFIVDEKGVKKPLKLGDIVQPGDTIITTRGVVVELELNTGKRMQISSEETVKFSPDFAADAAAQPDATDSAVDLATIQTIIKAIEEGKDINEVIESTAAGLNAGGDFNNHGFSFLELMRIEEVLNSFSYEFERVSQNFANTQQVIGGVARPFNEVISTTELAPSASALPASTITDTNDAPVISSGVQAGTVTEDSSLTASGQVMATDVDTGATLSYSGNATGTYGSFAVTAATGAWTYTLDNAAHQNLPAGASLSETFTVTVTDDAGATATQNVTITVLGTNDAPVITSAAQAGSVSEDGTTATGQVTATDADLGATLSYTGNASG